MLPDGAGVMGFETQYLTNNEIDDIDLARFTEDGDLTLYSQYRFIGDSDTHASSLLGVKTPTGKTDVMSDEGHRFEAEHQPGSGSGICSPAWP
jgi:hypothetical protein